MNPLNSNSSLKMLDNPIKFQATMLGVMNIQMKKMSIGFLSKNDTQIVSIEIPIINL